MNKEHRLTTLATTHFIGLRTETSLAEQGVPGLWRKFRPLAKGIADKSEGSYNITCYGKDLAMTDFTPLTRYEAWTTVKVDSTDAVPADLEVLTIPLGSYAVFDYQGLAKDFGLVAAQVFGEWLPAVNLTVDNTRPHFEYLPPGYRTDDPEAKEEIFLFR